jgi:hypothetical protein
MKRPCISTQFEKQDQQFQIMREPLPRKIDRPHWRDIRKGVGFTNTSMYSLWFDIFIVGCHIRMGDDI